MNTNITQKLDIIPQQELLNLLGYKSPESLRTLLKRDETAPKPFKPSGRKVFFVRSEVESWLESKKAVRG